MKKQSLNLRTNNIIRLFVVMFLAMMFLFLFMGSRMGVFGDSQFMVIMYALLFSFSLILLVWLYLKLVK